jgi:hypothetical protein
MKMVHEALSTWSSTPSNPKEGRTKMNSWLVKGMLAVAIALPALSGVARAGGTDDYGCSNATLKGAYAFAVNTWVLTDDIWVPGFVVGITTFDGNGKLTQTDYQEPYGYPAKFSTDETGTYVVNSNCTGSGLVDLNVLGVPPVTTQGGSIGLGFVISNSDRSIHGVVSEFTNPGATGPVPTSNIHVDRVDFWKVGSYEDN